MLESIPSFVRNEDVESLIERTVNNALATDVRLSPLADDALVALAERLVKLSPQDATAAKQLAEIKQHRATPPAESRLAHTPWGTIPPAAARLANRVARPCDTLRFRLPRNGNGATHGRRVLRRLWPGLQAKEQAAVALNLLPVVEKPGFLGGFTLTRKKPQPKGAWGLDLGPTGLRAIRLAPR